ncbi:MAG: alcohol dehydrogenase catalytic domain-containing protein [Christensenella sp.]|uniref:zinc-dependent alcohol dehydrogenase n=1 Tax=Christensenella sp. TaxID=1935934 RepID=UPI002B1F1635|nr:alcohol dehydrogenase catalytic domain-containing protein [Christensenella sp.]MEA5004086.1 alcohol dehydrogenase catalytic domain-containing protein [Christensenella sp.]
MKAFIAKEPGVTEFIEVEKPKLGPKDILAKVSYAGVCATDIALITGETTFVTEGLAKYPIRIGHEWSGIVTEVGEDVKTIKPGDHVIGENGVPCFDCPTCWSGNSAHCPNARSVGTLNTYDGCFAEYMKMPERLTYKLGDDTDLDEAALIEPASIAMAGIIKSGVKFGDMVMVIGTGPIGLTGVGLLKAIGCSVILVGRRDSKLEIGRQMGADYLLNSATQDIAEELKKITVTGRVNTIIESSGNVQMFKDCANYISGGGNVVLLGFFEKPIDDFNIDKFVVNDVNLLGVAGTGGSMPGIIELLKYKRVSFKPLISSVYNFNDAQEAVDHVIQNDGDRIKVLLKFD